MHSPTIADTTAATSVGFATVAGLTLNEWAACAAIVAAAVSIADRFGFLPKLTKE